MCRATARLDRLLTESCANLEKIAPLLAGRVIALDKKPSKSVGVVPRRVISKVAKPVDKRPADLQKCSGRPARIEAAVHAMQDIEIDESTEGSTSGGCDQCI